MIYLRMWNNFNNVNRDKNRLWKMIRIYVVSIILQWISIMDNPILHMPKMY